jgi:hypothetical protein
VKHRKPQPWAPAGKLSPENVAEIRRSTMSHADLAQKFKVCRRTIYRTRVGESWCSVA